MAAWWSSIPSLQGFSSALLLAGFMLTVIGGACGLAATILSNRAGDLLQSANDRLQRQTEKTIADVQAGARLGVAAAQERAAAADRTAQEARRRAAELELKAAEINGRLVRTQEVVTGRAVSPEQIEAMKTELNGQHFRVFICSEKEPEAEFFRFSLLTALTQAGLQVLEQSDCHRQSASTDPHAGVMLYVPGLPIAGFPSDPLYKALAAAKIQMGYTTQPADPQLVGIRSIMVITRSLPSAAYMAGRQTQRP